MKIDKYLMLIESVKSEPCLYDSSHPDFRKKRKRNEIWIELSFNLDEEDYRVVKAKWKNLRDNYMKYLRAQETQNDYRSRILKRYRAWPWAKHMSFLKPFIQSGLSKAIPLDENLLEAFTRDSNEQEPDSDNSDANEIEGGPSASKLLKSTEEDENRKTDEHSDDKIVTYVERKQRDICQFDDTDLLFLSYAKTVKKFSAHRQALTKFKIAKILMVAELEELKEY